MKADHHAGITPRGRLADPFDLIDQRLDQKHAHAARFLLLMHLPVDVRSSGVTLWPFAGIENFDFERVWAHRKNYADRQSFVELIAVFHGVDAGFGDGRFQIFDALVSETHKV